MRIGKLNADIFPEFTYADSKLPLFPIRNDDGKLLWKWTEIYDSAIDITYRLTGSCFIGAVFFALLGNSEISSAEVFVDGKLSGYYYAETGSTFGGEKTISVGVSGTEVTLRLWANLKDVALYEPEILGAFDDGIVSVWPNAKKIKTGKNTVALSGISPSADPDEMFAAEFLTSALSEIMDAPFAPCGVEVKFEKTNSDDLEKDEFCVTVDKSGVLIRAKSRLGLLYAIDVLLQLRRENEFLEATVEDKPDKEFRGVHIGLPKLDNFDFVRRLFRYVLIPLRYNTVIIEFAGGMRFDRRPEISEGWLRANKLAKEKKQPEMPHAKMGAGGTVLEKQDVRRLVGFAKELGLEVIPEVQSLGHVQYLTYVYPEIAEIDENEEPVKDLRAEDVKPDQFYRHSYCPSLDKSYEIIFDVIDEIVEVVEPERFVHIGHDEVYQIGICPRCKGTPADVLYERHVRTLYEYIKAKGLKTMLWGDMMVRDNVYATAPAIDRLPKDIVVLDFIWYFYFGKDTELPLLGRGYNVAVGNLYSSHFPRFTKRINRDGVLGGQISMWVETEEESMAVLGKFFDMAYLSEMLWNAESYDERLRPVYTRNIGSNILPKLRGDIRNNKLGKNSTGSTVLLPKCRADEVPQDILKHYSGAIIADNVTVEIQEKVDRLIFTHATLRGMPRTVWRDILKVGEYVVNYEDGCTQSITVGYGANVVAYNTTYGAPLPQQYYRHYGYIGTYFADPQFDGKCSDGKDLTLLAMPWDNPYPEKTISSVTFVPDSKATAKLVLAEIKTISK